MVGSTVDLLFALPRTVVKLLVRLSIAYGNVLL